MGIGNRFASYFSFFERGGEPMSEFFDCLITELLSEKKVPASTSKWKSSKTEFDKIYRKIIDQALIGAFEELVDNELLRIVFKQLSHTERLIILFNVMLEYEIADTADIIGSSRDSVYSLKHRALKKLQAAIADLDD
jgi:DNA-directed RNA polymerase specialized sigma24 family protein